MRSFRIFIVVVLAFSLGACESEEDNKILAAQMCFNDLGDTATGTQIDTCMAKIDGVETEGAYTIRCSGAFLKGGLTTSKLTAAFENYDKQPKDEQEAYLVSQVALSDTTVAEAAYNYCKKSGIPGLTYIATLSRIGTIITQQGGAVPIDQQIADCASGTATCDMAAIGEMASDMADLYCKGDAVDEQICIDIATAEANGGGDYAAIAAALLTQIGY